MQANEKTLIKLMAQKLIENKINIQNYDFDEAMSILVKNHFTDSELNLFHTNAFQVYMELMRIETVNSIHNSLRPM